MDPQPASGASALSPVGRWLSWRPPVWDEEVRRQVLDELFFEGSEWRPFLVRFAVLLVLSTTIAALGLIGDSSAVVIGAMLVAPLMTPILAVAGATVHGQLPRLWVSSAVLVAGTIAAVGTGWVIGWVAGGTLTVAELTSQLLARTSPSLLDLGVAVAAGLAGGYVLTHPRAGSSLPGVAIAVALVPPLATVGITLQLGAMEQAGGALLLYVTNMVAIILAAMVVMLLSGFVPPDVRHLARGRVRIGLLLAGLAVVGVAVPLTVHTVEVVADQRFGRQVVGAVAEWDATARVISLEADTGPDRSRVSVVMASAQQPQPAWELADLLATAVGHPVDVTVEYRLEQRDEASAG